MDQEAGNRKKDLLSVAEEELAKQMCSKATSHRRLPERMDTKAGEGQGTNI